MSEKEYFRILDQIKDKINMGKLDEAEGWLGKLYEYKPVKLSWFVADAELKLRRGCRWTEAVKELSPAIMCYGRDYRGMRDYRCFLEKNKAHCGEAPCRRVGYLSDLVCRKDISGWQKGLTQAVENYKNNPQQAQTAELAKQLHIMDEMAAYTLVRMKQAARGWTPEDKSRWYYQRPNFDYLELKAKQQRGNVFVVVSEAENHELHWILAGILSELGQNVYFVEEPAGPAKVKEREEWVQVLETSLRLARKQNNITIIPAFGLEGGEGADDNRDYIVDYVVRELTENDSAVVVASGKLLDRLAERKILKKRMGRLSEVYQNLSFLQHQVQFGWAGSYLSYISDIYGCQVAEGMREPSQCMFSIVIPARNSAGTLQYTLQTCLEQSCQGSYEIIVSDNSVNGKTEVYELCRDMADERIRYIRTPRDLPLSKSFEYAVLQARGEFILPIGSDDGLLPWALETLEDVRKRYPEEPVIQWYRGFYAWPGFNGGQENMFVIPCRIKKQKCRAFFLDRKDYLRQITRSASGIYLLPNLYINAGFKREYMWKILKKTGRMWDGWNQDVYMGVLNICINERILNVDEALTIAGMSSGSMGYLNLSNKTGKEKEKTEKDARVMLRWGNMGGYIFTEKERELPNISNDDLVMANAVLRAKYYGLMAEEDEAQLLDYKRIFANTFLNMSLEEKRFERFLQEAALLAENRGEEFKKWFMEAVYSNYANPVWYDAEAAEQAKRNKTYKEEKTAGGGMTVDASEYGVKNIAEAVRLYTRLGEYE